MTGTNTNFASRRGIYAILAAIMILMPVTYVRASTSFSGRNTEITVGATTLTSSDLGGIRLAVNAPDYQVHEMTISSNRCAEIAIPGFALSAEPGRPQLPYQVVLLGVPPDAELSLDVVPAEVVTGRLSQTACPTARTTSVLREDGSVTQETQAWAPDATVYAAAAFYPAQIARLVDLGFMRSQRIVRLELTPFQVNPATGETRYSRRVQLRVRFAGATDAGRAVSEPADFETIFRNALLNYDTARNWRSASGGPVGGGSVADRPQLGSAGGRPQLGLAGGVQPPVLGAWLPPTPAYRIAVESEGIYQLTQQDLANAGLPVASLDPRTIKMYNFGQELAIQVPGEEDGKLDAADRVIFYGQGVNTRYTAQNIYWLTYGGANGKRMAAQASVAGGAEAASFTETVHVERNVAYISTLPMVEGYDHWYDTRLSVLPGQTAGRNYGFTVVSPASGSYSATLEVMVGALTIGQHRLKLYVGQTGNLRQVLDTTAWFDRTMFHTTVSFPQSYLVAGANLVRVEIVNERTTAEIVAPDWFDIRYQRSYAVTGDSLTFGGDQAGLWRFTLDGFSTSAVDAYDVTDPTTVKHITIAAATGQTPAATFTFAANQTEPRRYVALTADQRKAPLAIQAAQTPDNLQQTTNRADYLIISHPDFLAALDPLVAQRTAQGLQVKKINVQDVYDQFGYGMMSAEAIQAFLAYAYDQWQTPRPTYVLLVGDGTYDLRRYLAASQPTYLPPYLAMIPDDPDTGETVADNRFVTLTGGDLLPDMHIGRFPVNNLMQAATMVSKTLGYENTPAPGDWTRQVLFVTDDLSHGGGDFYDYSNGIADGYADPPTNTVKILPAPYTATKVYMGPGSEPRATCPSENPSAVCRQNTIDALNAGALMTSYIGHGTKTYWSASEIMNLTALTALTNNNKLTIMLPMTCDNGYFALAGAGEESFGEASVRMAGGGAVASWSPTGFGLASGHDYMERGFFLSVFHDRTARIGAATTAGKVYLVQNASPGKYLDLLDTYLLLGDPAVTIPLAPAAPTPTPTATITPTATPTATVTGSARKVYLPLVVRQ